MRSPSPRSLRAGSCSVLGWERWEEGARVRFEHAHVAAASFEGEVLAFDPPRLLEISWGPDLLRF